MTWGGSTGGREGGRKGVDKFILLRWEFSVISPEGPGREECIGTQPILPVVLVHTKGEGAGGGMQVKHLSGEVKKGGGGRGSGKGSSFFDCDAIFEMANSGGGREGLAGLIKK